MVAWLLARDAAAGGADATRGAHTYDRLSRWRSMAQAPALTPDDREQDGYQERQEIQMARVNRQEQVDLKIEECRRSGSKRLDLSRMGLSKIPDRVRQLTQLRDLQLELNTIRVIPAWIGELTALEHLYLHGNPLQALPSSIARLKKLQTLILAGSSPEVAIPVIGELSDLRYLALAGLRLRSVPPWLRKLRKLKWLWLQHNPIRKIPEWIGELTDLVEVLLKDARLRALPGTLCNLRKLKRLDLNGNPQLRVPPEILEGTPTHILNYYFRTNDPAARQPLNEFKLILVGRGAVGKTTLVHRLVKDEFKTFRRTPGVQITKWPMTIAGKEARAHIWDFGGQEIMHETHRFFMTERALYLVLLSGREGSEDHDADYWLSLVRSFAGDVPVIVLLHKWDDYPFELNRALLLQKYGRISFLTTDSQTNHGIAELRNKIAELAGVLPGLKAAWPVAWQRIKDDLPRNKKSWLTFEDFCAFCRRHGVDSSSDQEALAGSLHDLGSMLSYRRDETLRRFGVLNPQWATKGIYQMLNSRAIREAGGTLTLRSFSDELPAKAYPDTLHPLLLALMLRFELCHPLDTNGNKYLIPELLGKEEPPLDSQFPPDECLHFAYHYTSVLPEGLLPRFIVDSYVHCERGLTWRSGAILERANCRAMVRGDLQARTVTIRVNGVGNGRRELLGIIRQHFERIHRSYGRLSVSAKVPIPGHPDVQVDYDVLLTYEKEGERMIPVPIGGHIKRFVVTKLLDGVDLPGVSRPSVVEHAGPGFPRIPVENALGAAISGLLADRQVNTLRTFVAYSRKDTAFRDQLHAALALHEHIGELSLWFDALVEAGQTWEEEILGRLERAHIVILLLSNDFWQSSYCMDQELPRALERRARGECEIIPIVVRACRYDKHEIGKIQAICPNGKSIDEHDKPDPAWKIVTQEIDRVIERIKKR